MGIKEREDAERDGGGGLGAIIRGKAIIQGNTVVSSVIYISSVIDKVQCLRKKGYNSDVIKEVTRKGRNIYPSDEQMLQYNPKDLSVLQI